MELKEYQEKNKITNVKLAKQLNISINMLGLIRNRKISPNLFIALKIYNLTKGKVDIIKLLSKGDERKLKDYVRKRM